MPPVIHPVELVPVADLRAHPRNYKRHPADQIAHIQQSLKEHGFYKNVVVGNGGVILAGHGVLEASEALGISAVPVVRLPYDADSAAAKKVLTGDNEIEHLSVDDDRLLADLLREIHHAEQSGLLDQNGDAHPDAAPLLGTGYDAPMLSNLAFVTRPASEIADHNEAAHWVGLPDYEPVDKPIRLVINFASADDRDLFFATYPSLPALTVDGQVRASTMWWPPKERDDLASMRFAAPGGDA